jgi:uncharacterized protein YqjF (DUF2071 family)
VDRFRPVIRQRWSSATFLHFRFDPERVQRRVPAGVRVEELDGSAWVSIVAFVAERTRLQGVPAVRFVPDYPETNVRTYVTTRSGERAVWFFSLEADSPAVVAAARSLLRVPYRWASMQVDAEPGRCRYVSRRRRGRPAGHRIEVEVGPALDGAEITELDVDLTARYRAVVPLGGGRLVVPVRHEPWPLHSASAVHLEEDLLDAAGLGAPAASPPDVRWSPGVDAGIGVPQRAG